MARPPVEFKKPLLEDKRECPHYTGIGHLVNLFETGIYIYRIRICMYICICTYIHI
jgi:hypothetical protein